MNELVINDEKAKWIDNYENRYAVTVSGKIFSYNKDGTSKELKSHVNDRGYLKIKLSKNGSYITKKIHRIVLETFGCKIIDKDHIDHIDENKLNNNIENLRWCTHKENIRFACKNRYGEDWEPQHKRTREEVEQRKIKIAKRKQDKIDNMKYGSVQEMINQTAKPVLVNGTRFQSAKEAARYICEDEDITAKVDTVRKSIKDMIDGKRKPWTYKGKYKMDTVCIPAVADKGILSLSTNRTRG